MADLKDYTVIKPLVPNSAGNDTFTAPDSTASRKSPETMTDRQRVPFNAPATAYEWDLNDR